jgi:hypothetical protein
VSLVRPTRCNLFQSVLAFDSKEFITFELIKLSFMKLKQIWKVTDQSIIAIIFGTIMGLLGLLLCTPFLYTLFTGTAEYGNNAAPIDYILYSLLMFSSVFFFRFSFYAFQHAYKLNTDKKYNEENQ